MRPDGVGDPVAPQPFGDAVVIGGHHRVGVGGVQEGAGAADRETFLARLAEVAPGQQPKT